MAASGQTVGVFLTVPQAEFLANFLHRYCMDRRASGICSEQQIAMLEAVSRKTFLALENC